MSQKHWSTFQLLHQVVQNKNIHTKGTHSYYSDCWDNGFEQSVVRYLHGDEISKQWQPRWDIDQLYICLLYTSPSPRDTDKSRMPSSA